MKGKIHIVITRRSNHFDFQTSDGRTGSQPFLEEPEDVCKGRLLQLLGLYPGEYTCEHLRPMPSAHRRWFDTLAQALESEGLQKHWPPATAVPPGETVVVNTPQGYHISVFRSKEGNYESPIHYFEKRTR
jgi:hypothetical protein